MVWSIVTFHTYTRTPKNQVSLLSYIYVDGFVLHERLILEHILNFAMVAKWALFKVNNFRKWQTSMEHTMTMVCLKLNQFEKIYRLLHFVTHEKI